MRHHAFFLMIAAAACTPAGSSSSSPPTSPGGHPTTTAQTTPSAGAADPVERALDEVATIHGAAGPWAVLGYRMSEHALGKLGLQRGSHDVQVVHWTPKEVRYSCIADGAAAHSGASLGKLNLSLVDTTADNVLTIYRDKKTGKSIALRPTATFREKYDKVRPDRARELGREVMTLPPEQVFEEIPVK